MHLADAGPETGMGIDIRNHRDSTRCHLFDTIPPVDPIIVGVSGSRRVFRFYAAGGGIPEHRRKGARHALKAWPGITLIPQPCLKPFDCIRNRARIEFPDGVQLVGSELSNECRTDSGAGTGGGWFWVECRSHGPLTTSGNLCFLVDAPLFFYLTITAGLLQGYPDNWVFC